MAFLPPAATACWQLRGARSGFEVVPTSGSPKSSSPVSAGVSGLTATAMAVGLQARVVLLDLNIDRLRAADQIYRGQVQTVASNAYEIERGTRRRPGLSAPS